MAVYGVGFSNADYSPRLQFAQSACEATTWVTTSSIACRTTGGVGGTHRVVVTAGMASGTLTEAFSFSVPSPLGNAWDVRTFKG